MKNTKIFRIAGIIAMVAVIGLSMAGCALLQGLLAVPEFPAEFAGTWERAGAAYPITFSKTTVSTSVTHDLEKVSGDEYSFKPSKGFGDTVTAVMKLQDDGSLAISIIANRSGYEYWDGTWTKH